MFIWFLRESLEYDFRRGKESYKSNYAVSRYSLLLEIIESVCSVFLWQECQKVKIFTLLHPSAPRILLRLASEWSPRQVQHHFFRTQDVQYIFFGNYHKEHCNGSQRQVQRQQFSQSWPLWWASNLIPHEKPLQNRQVFFCHSITFNSPWELPYKNRIVSIDSYAWPILTQ